MNQAGTQLKPLEGDIAKPHSRGHGADDGRTPAPDGSAKFGPEGPQLTEPPAGPVALAVAQQVAGGELVLVPEPIGADPFDLGPLARAFDDVDRELSTAARLLLKRTFDILAAAVALLLLSPLMLLIAALIKLGDGGPVFFVQRRVGLRGQTFRLLKFRSM